MAQYVKNLPVHIVGRVAGVRPLKSVGKDKTTSVLSFSLATEGAPVFSKGTTTISTIWLRCDAWGDLADWMASNVKAGQIVRVSGNFRKQEYQSKKDGKNHDAPSLTVSALGVDKADWTRDQVLTKVSAN